MALESFRYFEDGLFISNGSNFLVFETIFFPVLNRSQARYLALKEKISLKYYLQVIITFFIFSLRLRMCTNSDCVDFFIYCYTVKRKRLEKFFMCIVPVKEET